MKKQLLLLAIATVCITGRAQTPPKDVDLAVPSSAAKTELMGFDTESFGGQEIRIAVTKETIDGAYAYCRQYVQSYSHEIAPGDNSSGSLPVDKTTIVLGKQCKWTKG
jgi:hypothetical protein